jgi:hypothetical protein
MSRAVVDTRIKTDLVQEKNTSCMRTVQEISPGVIWAVMGRRTVDETIAWLAIYKTRSPYVSCVRCTGLPQLGAVGLGVDCNGLSIHAWC